MQDDSIVLRSRKLLVEGISFYKARKLEQAACAFAAMTTARPADPIAWLCLARCRFTAGSIPEARQACEQGLRLDRDSLRGQILLARIAARTKNHVLQVSSLRRAIDLSPRPTTLLNTLADILLSRRNFQGAITTAERVLLFAPTNAEALLVMVKGYIGAGRPEDARTYLERLDPKDINAVDFEALRKAVAAKVDPTLEGQQPIATSDANPSRTLPSGDGRGAIKPHANTHSNLNNTMFRTGSFDFEDRVDTRDLLQAERVLAEPAFIDHLFIVYALILRDIQRNYRHNLIGVFSELIRPVVVIVAHYWLFKVLRKPMEGGIPIEIFVLAGFSIWFVFNAIWSDTETGSKWTAGATLMPSVTNLHVRAAKAIWHWLLYVCFCLVAVLPFKIYGYDFMLPDVPKSCLIFAITGGLGFGLGLVFERLAVFNPVMKTLGKLISWLLYVTSGLYFSFESLPPWVAGWFWYNPLLHLVELERGAFDPGYKIAKLDLSYPTTVMVCLLTLGTFIYRIIRKKIHE